MTTTKRSRDQHVEDITTMANCLMLLSNQAVRSGTEAGAYSSRVFECKTCNRQFSSFQALGGHRASHKKPRLMNGSDQHLISASPPKPKTHECSICGLEFAIGQALGGHMRRHKSVLNDQSMQPILPLSLSLHPQAPIVRKPNVSRVFCLDLNLTPSENKFLFGKILNAPVLDCFF